MTYPFRTPGPEVVLETGMKLDETIHKANSKNKVKLTVNKVGNLSQITKRIFNSTLETNNY